MSTLVTTLQERMVAHLGLQVGDTDVSEAELLADINQVYRFDIPEAVGSGRFRELISVSVAAGTSGRTDVNVVPTTALYGSILGSWAAYKLTAETTSSPLQVYSAPRDFWAAYDPANTTRARPTGILIEETLFTLRPIPIATGVVFLDALQYRTPALGQSDSVGLDFEAKLIEYAGAAYAALRLGDDDSARRLTTLAGPLFDKLRALERRSSNMPSIGRNF